MTDPFAERVFGIPWLVLAGAAAVVAAVYIFVPIGTDVTGLRWFVLRWFHTIAWLFLALAALARSKVTGTPVEFAAPLGATGGLIYVIFMLTTLAGGGSS
jgi:peptidoglycan/LPS O-acetylase OafA/YrhL